MVKKIFEIPRILYHGTVKEYHDRVLTECGRYKNKGYQSVVYLDRMPGTPIGYALQRAEEWGEGTPALLIIDSLELSCRIKTPQPWHCDYLDNGSYTLVELVGGRKFTHEKYSEIMRIAEAMVRGKEK